MSDHLDFIRIHGLEDSDTEVFQGLSADAASTGPGQGSGGGSTPAPVTEWTAFPNDAIDMIKQYAADMEAWHEAARNYSADEMSRELLPAVPSTPAILGTMALAVASGGVSLPVLAAGFIMQTLLTTAQANTESYARSLDPNSPESLFRKAFLYKDGGEEKSIFLKALLYALSDSKTTDANIKRSVLDDRLKDLNFNDLELALPGGGRIQLRGKYIAK